MYSRILVCTDGTAEALVASRVAAVLGKKFEAHVLVLNICEVLWNVVMYPGDLGTSMVPGLAENVAKEQFQVVKAQNQPIFVEAGVDYTLLQEQGNTIETITEVADREKVDLVIVGSREQNEFQALFLGSVSRGVLHNVHRSVLVAGGDGLPSAAGWFRKVLVAVDGSEGSIKAAMAASEIAKRLEATLTLLHCLDSDILEELPEIPHDPEGDLDPDTYEGLWHRYLQEKYVVPLKEMGVEATIAQEVGRPHETLLRYANEYEHDLIVVGSRGHGTFHSLLLGSVSERVATHAHCPVLVVR